MNGRLRTDLLQKISSDQIHPQKYFRIIGHCCRLSECASALESTRIHFRQNYCDKNNDLFDAVGQCLTMLELDREPQYKISDGVLREGDNCDASFANYGKLRSLRDTRGDLIARRSVHRSKRLLGDQTKRVKREE